MKRILVLLFASLSLFALNGFALDDGGPGKGNKKTQVSNTYRGQRTYQPKRFYQGGHAPKKHSSKSMPSKTRHIAN